MVVGGGLDPSPDARDVEESDAAVAAGLLDGLGPNAAFSNERVEFGPGQPFQPFTRTREAPPFRRRMLNHGTISGPRHAFRKRTNEIESSRFPFGLWSAGFSLHLEKIPDDLSDLLLLWVLEVPGNEVISLCLRRPRKCLHNFLV